MTGVLQHESWTTEPAFLGDAWTMKRDGLTATCALFSHQSGCELRLTFAQLLHTQVCRSTEDCCECRRKMSKLGSTREQLIELSFYGIQSS